MMATKVFGRYAPLLQQLHNEMCKAIFPDFSTANDDWMGSSPFFVRTNEVARKLHAAETQLHAFSNKEDFMELENQRRQFAVSFTVKCWRAKGLYHMFIRWKLCSQHTVVYRKAMDKNHGGTTAERMVPKLFRQWKDTSHRAKINKMKLALKNFQRGGAVLPAGDGSAESNDLIEQVKLAREQRWSAEDQKAELARVLFGLRDVIAKALGDTKATLMFEGWIEMATRMQLADAVGPEYNRLVELADSTESAAQTGSATRIQTIFRGRVSRREVGAKKQETMAAKKIQQMMRGKADRKHFLIKRDARKKASKDSKSVSITDLEAQNLKVAVEVLQYETEELDSAIKSCPDLSQLGFDALDISIDDAEVETVAATTLVRWVNIHLEATKSDRRLNSMSSDLRDGVILAALLDRTAGTAVTKEVAMCAPGDHSAAAAIISKTFSKLNSRTAADRPGAVLKAAHILEGSEPHVHHALAKLFLSRHSLPSLGWSDSIEENENVLVAIELEWRAAQDSGSITRAKLASLINRVHVYAASLDAIRAKLLDESTRWFNTKRCIERFAIACVNKYLGVMELGTSSPRARGDMEFGEYNDITMSELLDQRPSLFDGLELTPDQVEDEETKLRQSIETYCALLFRIFTYRCSSSGSSGEVVELNLAGWQLLVNDCRIPSGELAHIVAAQTHSDLFSTSLRQRKQNNFASDALPFSEFLLLCVELAAVHLDQELRTHERFELLVLKHVIPFAQPSNSQLFNSLIGQLQVKEYFDRREAAFQRIYMLFAAADDDDDDNLTIMNMKEFSTYVHDCQLQTSCGMTALKAKKIFRDVVGLASDTGLANTASTKTEDSEIFKRELSRRPSVCFSV